MSGEEYSPTQANPHRQARQRCPVPGSYPGSDLAASEKELKIPGGFLSKTGPLRLPGRAWSRHYISRPKLLIPEGDITGVLYVYECQRSAYYQPLAPITNSQYLSREYRRGQPILLPRPGEYSFFLDQVDPGIYREQDAASYIHDDPVLHHIVGYDPTIGKWRTIKSTAADPAQLYVLDPDCLAVMNDIEADIDNIEAGLLAPAAATVTNSYPVPTGVAANVLAANAARKFASVYNDGLVVVYLRADGNAAAITDLALVPGATYTIEPSAGVINRNAISGITGGVNGSLAIEDWV